jgi:hypothetical protein
MPGAPEARRGATTNVAPASVSRSVVARVSSTSNASGHAA